MVLYQGPVRQHPSWSLLALRHGVGGRILGRLPYRVRAECPQHPRLPRPGVRRLYRHRLHAFSSVGHRRHRYLLQLRSCDSSYKRPCGAWYPLDAEERGGAPRLLRGHAGRDRRHGGADGLEEGRVASLQVPSDQYSHRSRLLDRRPGLPEHGHLPKRWHRRCRLGPRGPGVHRHEGHADLRLRRGGHRRRWVHPLDGLRGTAGYQHTYGPDRGRKAIRGDVPRVFRRGHVAGRLFAEERRAGQGQRRERRVRRRRPCDGRPLGEVPGTDSGRRRRRGPEAGLLLGAIPQPRQASRLYGARAPSGTTTAPSTSTSRRCGTSTRRSFR